MDVELNPYGFNALRMCRWGPMLYNKNDTSVGRSIAKYGEYSWLEQTVFGQVLNPGAIVVEVGANIGAHTIPLSRLAGPNGAVLAFEPERILFQTLCANIALNNCLNVWAFNQAVGAANGMIPVPALDPRVSGNYGAIALDGRTGSDSAPLRTVDSLQLNACTLLKVDVEGMEGDVIRGAAQTITACRPVIYVENNRREKSPELIRRLLEFRYDVYWHVPPLFNPENFAGDTEDIFPGIVSPNLLCYPAEMAANVQGFRKVTSPEDWIEART